MELRRSHPAVIAGLLVSSLTLTGALPADTAANRLQIDPLLLAEAEMVWSLIAVDDNPIWPGWNAAATPLLFYLPGLQDVLINHTDPPEGFVPYSGPHTFAGGEILVSDGPTWIEWDGQNTARELNGVATLVVADSLSNLKQTVRGYLSDPRPAEQKLADLEYESLRTDPYEQMATITHEAFHVFQDHAAPGKGANEADARLYPCLSVDNNVAVALEATALEAALRADGDDALRAAALGWLAIRLDRRAALPAKVVAYEDGNEFSEGIAMYTEWRLATVLEGRSAPAALWWAHGFHGLDDLSHMRDERLERLRASLRGEININNDPYGMSPVRGRLYFSGMAIAAMLDRIAPDWKGRIFDADVTLTSLVEQALDPTAAELSSALARARDDPDYALLVEQKRKLAEEGRRDTQAMVDAILEGEGTLVTLDWSELGDPKIGLSFTPFGVRAVDADRTIYTLVPISSEIGSKEYGFRQQVPAPTLDDRAAKLFRFQLSERVGADELEQELGPPTDDRWLVDGLTLKLPGVELRAGRALIEQHATELRLRLLPAETKAELLRGTVVRKEWTKSYESWNAGGSEYFVLDVGAAVVKDRSAAEGVILRPSPSVSFESLERHVGKSVEVTGEYLEAKPYTPVDAADQYPVDEDGNPQPRGSGFKVTGIRAVP